MSTYGYGVIVEGVAAIRQRIDLAIRTTKGSDPLRPEFGSNVYKYVDAPDSLAIPNIKREILNSLDIWVKDIKVTGIKSFLKATGNPVFEVTFRLVDDSLTQSIVFDLQSGVVSSNAVSELIVQAFFPSNPNNFRYTFNFRKNGVSVLPLQDPDGYRSIAEMFLWMQINYSYLGKWYLLSDRIVCYMNADGVTSASLSLSVLANVTRFEADFPVLDSGQTYQVKFTANGVDLQSDLLLTPGQVLAWVLSNWSQYATWEIAFVESVTGQFSSEFSDEFVIDITGYKLIGRSDTGVTGILNIVNVG